MEKYCFKKFKTGLFSQQSRPVILILLHSLRSEFYCLSVYIRIIDNLKFVHEYLLVNYFNEIITPVSSDYKQAIFKT